MLIQISSGNGVDEVCRAIWYFKEWLEKNYAFELVDEQLGRCPKCLKSFLIESDDQRLLALEKKF